MVRLSRANFVYASKVHYCYYYLKAFITKKLLGKRYANVLAIFFVLFLFLFNLAFSLSTIVSTLIIPAN